jgi:hypothetical protein
LALDGMHLLSADARTLALYPEPRAVKRREIGDEQGLGRAGVGTRFRYRTGITRAILLVRLFDFQVDGF